MAQTRKPTQPPAPVADLETTDYIEEEDELLEEGRNGRVFDVAILLLCLVGIGISSYLTYTHIAHARIVCLDGNSCDVVNSSKYAYIFGIPVAYLGLLFYIALLGGSVARAVMTNRLTKNALVWRRRLDLGLFVYALLGFAFTAYLQAMEVFVIGAICTWCVSSAITITILLVLYTVRFLRA